MHGRLRWPQEQTFTPHMGRSVSIDRAAELLGVSRRTVYNRIGDGRLETIRTLGGSQRVLVESLAVVARSYGRQLRLPNNHPDAL
jgi:excisionase family DNA binding protein